MGQQIIKQPDGKYAVWSSNVDYFVFVNASPADIIEYFVEKQREDITATVTKNVAALENGEKPYHQFTMTWDEAIETIRHVHGTVGVMDFLNELETK